VKFRTIIVISSLQKIDNKCFNEEVKASNKNCKVNKSAVCFLYNIFFLCYFYSGSFILFSSGKSGWLWKQQVVGWLEKNRLLLLTLTFITKTKQ